jgi:hypothetical protein
VRAYDEQRVEGAVYVVSRGERGTAVRTYDEQRVEGSGACGEQMGEGNCCAYI